MKVNRNTKNEQVVPVQPNLRSSGYSGNKVDQGIITETVLKLFFSVVIGLTGIASLVKLVPYYNTQQAKLKELRSQVQETEVRVLKLREELNRNFDPQQTQNLIEEYSGLTLPDRIQVFVRDTQHTPISDSKIVAHPKQN